MWVLEHVTVPNIEAEGKFILLPGIHSAGRLENESDIFCQHASISRKHAVLSVEVTDENVQTELTIKDSSRYGTSIDGQKLSQGGTKQIQSEEGLSAISVQFGFKHIFKLHWEAIHIVTLTPPTSVVKESCRQLGFGLTGVWTPVCTHVLTSKAASNLTPLCLWALLNEISVVTEKWLSAWKRRKTLKDDMPDALAFGANLTTGSGINVSHQQLDALHSSKIKGLFAGLHFCLNYESKENAVLEEVLRLCGASLAAREGDSVISILKSEKDASPAPTPNTTLQRITGCLLSQSRNGLLVKQAAQFAPKTQVEEPADSKSHHADDAEETDAEEEEGSAEMKAASPEKLAVQEVQPSVTQHKTTEGPLEGTADLTYTVSILKTPKPVGRRKDSQGKQKDFKAFRRRQSNTPLQPKILQVFKVGTSVPAVDATAFLNSERLKRERAEAADELFTSKVPLKKVTAAKRGRIV